MIEIITNNIQVINLALSVATLSVLLVVRHKVKKRA